MKINLYNPRETVEWYKNKSKGEIYKNKARQELDNYRRQSLSDFFLENNRTDE